MVSLVSLMAFTSPAMNFLPRSSRLNPPAPAPMPCPPPCPIIWTICGFTTPTIAASITLFFRSPRAKTMSSVLISFSLIGWRSLETRVFSPTFTVTGSPPASGARTRESLPTEVTLPTTLSPGGMFLPPRSCVCAQAGARLSTIINSRLLFIFLVPYGKHGFAEGCLFKTNTGQKGELRPRDFCLRSIRAILATIC